MSIKREAQQKALEELWRQGLSGHELLHRHTATVDQFITGHYEQAVADHRLAGEIAIIALGGYGRRELYPFSDIDLLLLHDRKAAGQIKAVAESLLYPLWDSGFEVGHSVRTVNDAVRFAAEDFFFRVAVLDARFLAGSAPLHEELLRRYRKKLIEGCQHKFFQTMELFRDERRRKYGSHSYQLEPHIKEGKGGMRDIQAMLWVAKMVFGLSGLPALAEAAIITSEERQAFATSWNMLARIRNRLHHLSRRKNDQLVFQYQAEMAELFGYRDAGSLLAVEQFMRDVYSHLQTIAVTTDLFFEHVRDVLGLSGPCSRETVLEKEIVGRKGAIHVTAAETLSARPQLLMRLFLQASRTGWPLHHRTKKLVTQHLALVDDKFRHSSRNAKAFLEILLKCAQPLPVLENMLEVGLLSAYLPEYGDIESLAQHDLYHIYTVDRHQLQTVAELALLRQEQAELFASLAAPQVLCLAALLHDIGKGKQADHSQLGAELVAGIGARLGLDETQQATLSFLVRYHLFLPENALRRDLEDQEFISNSAGIIGNSDRLTMLYLLAVADSRATGPSAWSSWKASLLQELFFKLKARLASAKIPDTVHAVVSEGQQHGAAWLRSRVRELLAAESAPRLTLEELPDDYLLSFAPETVAGHLRIHRDQQARLQQQVLVFPTLRQEYGSLLVMSTDRPGLLAKLCGVLTLHNLRVLAANIFTWPDGTVVDVIEVTPLYLADLAGQDWLELECDCNKAINYRLDIGYQLLNKLGQHGGRPRPAVQQLEQKVIIDNEASRRFSVVEVYGCDQLGTLYKLTQVMTDLGLNIHRAKIATEVEQLINIFYVTTRDGAKLDDPATRAQCQENLLQIVGPAPLGSGI